jgi:hypothetical protein
MIKDYGIPSLLLRFSSTPHAHTLRFFLLIKKSTDENKIFAPSQVYDNLLLKTPKNRSACTTTEVVRNGKRKHTHKHAHTHTLTHAHIHTHTETQTHTHTTTTTTTTTTA